MRWLYLCTALLALSLTSPQTAFSQAMIEHAVTAAGGSAAGVAGKGVSKGIDKIFGKLKTQSDKAAAQARVSKRLTPQDATGTVKAPDIAPIQGAIQVRPVVRSSQGPESRQIASAPQVWTMEDASPVVRQQASVEDLEAVEAGTSRRDLVSRLGTPSARIMIPEAGELREVYHFSSNRTHLGSVTLSNGSVANVEVDPTAR